MRRHHLLQTAAAGAVAALLAGASAYAQTAAPTSPARNDPAPVAPKAAAGAGSGNVLVMQHESEKTTGELIGLPVFSRDGTTVGKVSQLLIDQDHKVVGAVLSVGGFLGIGSKSVAVPWDSLRIDNKGGKALAVTTMTADDLAAAPEFKTLAQLKSEQDAARIKEDQKARDMSRPAAPAQTPRSTTQ